MVLIWRNKMKHYLHISLLWLFALLVISPFFPTWIHWIFTLLQFCVLVDMILYYTKHNSILLNVVNKLKEKK